MSATRQKLRAGHDYYPTPTWCTVDLYRTVGLPYPTLDPGAGTGGLIGAMKELYPRRPLIRGVEIQEELVRRANDLGFPVELGDGLELDWRDEHILMNPPYKDAMVWVKKAVEEASSTTALLRLGFLASQRRKAFMRENPPQKVVVLSRRPSFTGKGGDSADYAWLHWSKQESLFGSELAWIG